MKRRERAISISVAKRERLRGTQWRARSSRSTTKSRRGHEELGVLALGRRPAKDPDQVELMPPGDSDYNKHVHRVSTALALISLDEENPLSPDRWNAREAYLIQVCAAMPWIRDGEAAKLCGRSMVWVGRLRAHPDFKMAVQKMISIVSRAMAVQMEVLQHRSFDILRERLDSDNEDARYEAAMSVLRGTGVLTPKTDVSATVTHKFEALENESVAKIRAWMWERERKEQKELASGEPVVIEGKVREVETVGA